jgi:plastocyanin
MKVWRVRFLGALAVVALIAVGCGGNGDGEEAAPTTSAAETTTEDSPSPTEETPSPAASPTAEESPDETPADCSPSGEIEVEAEDISFDTDCVAASAGVPFEMEFKNRDSGIPHNFAIYTEEGGDALFQGRVITGAADATYQVDAIDAGQYYFQCDIHPSMNGTFVAA